MASIKKLYTVVVEDSLNSSEEALLLAGNQAAKEYASVYDWTDISVSRSSSGPKIISGITYHFFDVYGLGEAQDFNQNDFLPSPTSKGIDPLAAKEISP